MTVLVPIFNGDGVKIFVVELLTKYVPPLGIPVFSKIWFSLSHRFVKGGKVTIGDIFTFIVKYIGMKSNFC